MASVTNQLPPKAPRLPIATPAYDKAYLDQLNNILRLYFNQIDNVIQELLVANQVPYGLQVAKGLVPGTSGLFKFGFNADIDLAEETVWTAGGIYVYPASALAMTIVSSSANDTAAGTGVHTVTVIGLDANYVETTQTITLNGTTPVSIPTPLIRVYRAFVVTAGSANTAAGVINIANGGTTYAQIALGDNQTLMAVYTVPAGYTLYMTESGITTGTAGGSQYMVSRLIQRPFGGVFREQAVITAQSGQVFFDGTDVPLRFPEKTDIEVRAYGSAINNQLSAVFAGYLVLTGT